VKKLWVTKAVKVVISVYASVSLFRECKEEGHSTIYCLKLIE